MNESESFDSTTIANVAPTRNSSLDHLGLIVVQGTDAAAFLDAQLTNNVAVGAAADDARLSGYCSPKGRLLATFVQWTDGENYFLQTSRDIIETVLKRLRMFVLRSKVTLADASDSFVQYGLIDASEADGKQVWGMTRGSDRWSIRFPDADGARRTLLIVKRNADPQHEAASSPVDASLWRWGEIRAGLPRITAQTQDRFVPQMINFEALGGVDFKKGCFPGQEVVARSQYRGKLKRRMALATGVAKDIAAAPGIDVFVASDDSQACGRVVNAEHGPNGELALLIELPLALFASDALRLATANGPALRIDPLPYSLPDN